MGFFDKIFRKKASAGNQKTQSDSKALGAEELSREAGAHVSKGDIEGATAQFTKATEQDPDQYQTFFDRGTVLLNEGKFEQAVADATKCIELGPARFEGYFLRGLCLHRMKRPGRAVSDLCRAIELNPLEAEVFSRRGRVLFDLNCFDRALADFRVASRLQSSRACILKWDIALCLDSLNCPREALAAYQDFISSNPAAPPQARATAQERVAHFAHVVEANLFTSADEHGARAIALMDSTDYGEILAELSRAIAKGDRDSDWGLYGSYLHRGEVLFKLELDDLALLDFTQAIQIDPERPQAYADRGDLFYERKRYDLAEDDYLKALSQYPKKVELLDLSTGEETVCEINPETLPVHDSLGILYFNTGRVQEALEQFESAVRGAPGNGKYQEHLKIAREKAAQLDSRTS